MGKDSDRGFLLDIQKTYYITYFLHSLFFLIAKIVHIHLLLKPEIR